MINFNLIYESLPLLLKGTLLTLQIAVFATSLGILEPDWLDARLLPRGDEADTTAVYLISAKPFEHAVQGIY